MMRQYELVERVLAYDAQADEALLNRAYVYAMKAHGNQKRASGDPYFSHPIEVAAILTELKLDDATIATALLHDVIEDTDTTRTEIDEMFGKEIGSLVDGLTKIKKLDLVTKKAQQAENFRKLLVAISSDIRVLLVKLADRLHNMRTLEHKKPESRLRVSEETLEIYAPLAGRMGMQSLREELEDLAFKWLWPDAYRTVTSRLEGIRQKNRGLIEEILAALRTKLEQAGIKAQVTGREKKPYSIWRKMELKHITLEQLSDIYGFRIVVGIARRLLSFGRRRAQHVAGRAGTFQGLHLDAQAERLSVAAHDHRRPAPSARRIAAAHRADARCRRIRRRRARALQGSAGARRHATSRGCHGTCAALDALPAGGEMTANPYHWLRRLVATLLEGDNSEEFLEHTKLELFQDQVFCFTPKGWLIAMPRGAKPIDFAYAVHTDVGNSCVGCKINGRHASLMTELRNGDEVEIVRSQAQTPPAAWESVVVTGKARSAIRRASREAVRQQFSELGRRMLTAHFEKLGQRFSDEALKTGLPRLSQRTIEEVMAAVGRGELAAAVVARAVYPNLETPEPAKNERRARNRFDKVPVEEGWFNLRGRMGLVFKWPGRATANGPEPANASAAEPGHPHPRLARRSAGGVHRRRRRAG